MVACCVLFVVWYLVFVVVDCCFGLLVVCLLLRDVWCLLFVVG